MNFYKKMLFWQILAFVLLFINIMLLFKVEKAKAQYRDHQLTAVMGRTDKPNTNDLLYDFDTLRSNEKAIANFTIVNKGKYPARILKVLSGCECTVVQWDKTIMAPGESSLVKVKYNTEFIGPFYKIAHVYLSDHPNEPRALMIKGVVIAPR